MMELQEGGVTACFWSCFSQCHKHSSWNSAVLEEEEKGLS